MKLPVGLKFREEIPSMSAGMGISTSMLGLWGGPLAATVVPNILACYARLKTLLCVDVVQSGEAGPAVAALLFTKGRY